MNLMQNIFLSRLLYEVAALVIVFSSTGFSLNNTLRGLVVDSETNQSIPLVTIEIVESGRMTITSDSGYFFFNKLQDGDYSLKLIHLSYKEKLIKLKFNSINNKLIIIYLEPKQIEISTVTVSDFDEVKSYDDLLELSNTLKGKELTKELGFTLAATLKNETGLSIRSMGSAPSRPIIRGLGSDRIIISEDGNKATDLSATSPDHAVTIEPFSSEKVEIIRGPKVLTKTSTSIGGLINIIKHEIPISIHEKTYGTAGSYFESMNHAFLTSLQAEIPFTPFSSKIELSKSSSNNVHSAEGELKNSNANNYNLSAGLSYFFHNNMVGFSVREYSLEYGIPGGFIGAHPFGADIKLFRQQANARLKLNFHNFFYDSFEFNYSLVKYRHQEFEHSGRIGSEFRIINNLARVELSHKNRNIFSEGILGFSFENRDFNVGGFVFTSPSLSYNYSLYALETVKFNKLIIELSVRLSHDIIKPYQEKLNTKIGDIRRRVFTNYSTAAAFIYQVTKVVHVGINISKSSRVPTIEELYSEGPHLAAYSYEVGNPDLKSESGWSGDLFVYHKFTKLYYNFNFFYYSFDKFIIPRNNGEINYSTFLPIYETVGLPARLFGFESQIEWNFWEDFYLTNNFNYTIGEFSNTKKPLPQIPPTKGFISLEYRNDIFLIGIKGDFAFSQKQVDNFETKTSGFLIFNAFANYTFDAFRNIHSVSLQLENLTNKIYRNHLSRIKVIMPEPGFNARIIYKLYFHL